MTGNGEGFLMQRIKRKRMYDVRSTVYDVIGAKD